MLHNVVLGVLGVVLIVLLSAIFETVALKKHPWLARFLAAALVVVMAYAYWGYHVWWVVLIIVGFAFAMLQVMRHVLHESEKK
jgi:fatty acid desaturase